MKKQISDMKDLSIKTLAVIGLLAVLALASFTTIMAIKYVPRALSAAAVSISSIFSGAPSLEVEASPLDVKNGQPFNLSWELSRKDSGSYSLSYSCVDGVTLEVSTQNGKRSLLCNEIMNLENETQAIVIPTSSKNRYADILITVSFKKEDSNSDPIKNTATVTITNESLSTSAGAVGQTGGVNTGSTNNGSTNTGSTGSVGSNTNTGSTGTTGGTNPGQTTTITYPTTPTTPVSNPNGKADFRPKILEIGIIDPISQKFIATSTVRRSDRIAVRFEVENIGNKISGDWNFNAILPTSPSHTFNADTQPKLNPGDKIEYTIGFDRALDGNVEFKVVVDGGDRVIESDETNNSAIVKLNIL